MNSNTCEDNVKNSDALKYEDTLKSIVELIHNSRYLAARKLWDALNDAIINGNASQVDKEFMSNLSSHRDEEIMRLMIERSNKIKETLDIGSIDTSWTFGTEYQGVTTHFKSLNDGTIQFRLEGIQERIPIFEQCAVVHEVDLFKDWIPFCSESILIDKIGNAEVLAYVFFNVLFTSRDTLIRAYGADCLNECNKIVIIGESVSHWDESKRPASSDMLSSSSKKVPFKEVSWTHNRVDVYDLAFIMDVLSPSTAKTVITARVDCHLFLPQSLLNFLIKNLAGVFLHLFQQQALKVSGSPGCPHNERIRSNAPFYLEWVFPKLKDLCESKGWDVPSTAAFSPLPTHE